MLTLQTIERNTVRADFDLSHVSCVFKKVTSTLFMLQKLRYCTSGRALKVSVCLLIGCLLLGSMQLYLWTYDSSIESCRVRRSATVGDSLSLFSIWSWITEMLIFLVVPLVILVVNVFVVRKVGNKLKINPVKIQPNDL